MNQPDSPPGELEVDGVRPAWEKAAVAAHDAHRTSGSMPPCADCRVGSIAKMPDLCRTPNRLEDVAGQFIVRVREHGDLHRGAKGGSEENRASRSPPKACAGGDPAALFSGGRLDRKSILRDITDAFAGAHFVGLIIDVS